MNTQPIGIFGGAFDPIHWGHLRAAVEVTEHFSLETVYFVPCQVPVHKPSTLASPEHRLAMLKLAISEQKNFQADDREICRETPSYMVETLRSFREQIGMKTPLALILGLDALLGFTTWYHWQEIFEWAHLIVVSRGEEEIEVPLPDFLVKRKNDDSKALRNTPAGMIFFQQITRLDITSTQIRTLIANQKSPRYLIPNSVWTYIQQQHLYDSQFN